MVSSGLSNSSTKSASSATYSYLKGVWSGRIPIEKAHSLQEVGSGKRTMKQELERIGYLGAIESSFSAMPIAVIIILLKSDEQKS